MCQPGYDKVPKTRSAALTKMDFSVFAKSVIPVTMMRGYQAIGLWYIYNDDLIVLETHTWVSKVTSFVQPSEA